MIRLMFKRSLTFVLVVFSGLALAGAGHKFYVSITQVDINIESHKLEISARIFTEDLEAAMLAETGQKLRLGSDHEFPKADSLLFEYLMANLAFSQDGAHPGLVFIGKEIEADVTWIYAESREAIATEKPVTIRNEFLFEKFPDQKNLVNLKFGKQTSSQIHTKGHPEFTYPGQ
jgi:hypothetical protein